GGGPVGPLGRYLLRVSVIPDRDDERHSISYVTCHGRPRSTALAPVRIARQNRWDLPVEEALCLQRRLAAAVDTSARLGRVRLVAGADAAYHPDGERLVAGVVVVVLPGLEVVEEAWMEGRVTFPYVPGLLGFREAPIVLRACARLRARP